MAKHEYKEVGRVKIITRYPVKSMAGEEVPESRIGWHGLRGDRRHAFVRLNDTSGFPWLTAREVPQLVAYCACYADSNDPERSPIVVRAPHGAEFDVRSPDLAAELQRLAGEPIHLLQLYSGIFDANDLSLVTTSSMDAVSREAGLPTDHRRFRANLVLEASDERPFPEDRWVGELLVFGDRADSARVRIYRRDLRCVVVDISPETGTQGGDLLKVIARTRKNNVGVYAGAERPGTVAVGDIVRIET